MKISDKVKIQRNALKTTPRNFMEVFKGFETVDAVKKTFGRNTKKVLSTLIVKPNDKWPFMWIDDKRGCLVVNPKYLRTGSFVSIYLDTIHELVHIKQHMQGKKLFYDYDYLEWPTEVEAYSVSAKEAKRIGMNKKQIMKYLKMEWPKDQGQWNKFFRRLKLV